MSAENNIHPFPPSDRDMSEPDPFSQALASESRQLFSQAHGDGRRYPLGGQYGEPQAYLEVFPQNHVVRYQGEGISIAGQFHEEPFVQPDRLVFSTESDHEFRSLTITDQGEVTLFVAPNPPLREPDPLDQAIAQAIIDERLIESAIATQKIAAEQPKPQESNIKTTTNTEPLTEKAKRVELAGRAGRDPVLRETAKGVKIAKFPLAEHPDGQEGETVWHTIVSFKDLAKKVSETVHKGDQLKVIGYRNERNYNGRTIEEINAVVVKPPKTPPTQ